jgi:simple sugar transport system permease protein
VVFGQAMESNLGLPVSMLLGLGVGVLWGAFNGYLIAILGFSPIIITLGGLAGARGLAEFVTQGFTTYGYGPEFAFLGNGKLLGRARADRAVRHRPARSASTCGTARRSAGT